jgi:hypothetical protein
MKPNILAAMLVLTASAGAANAESISTSAECATTATGNNGLSQSCNSAPSIIRAPNGYVFNQQTSLVTQSGAAGGVHHCRFGWSDTVEVVPGTGLTAPRAFSLTAHAESPTGHGSPVGWANCTAMLALARLPLR